MYSLGNTAKSSFTKSEQFIWNCIKFVLPSTIHKSFKDPEEHTCTEEYVAICYDKMGGRTGCILVFLPKYASEFLGVAKQRQCHVNLKTRVSR